VSIASIMAWKSRRAVLAGAPPKRHLKRRGGVS
jgi:hypothetical protein